MIVRRRRSSRPAGAPQSALHFRDALRVATMGLRARRMRTSLSALGIAIGIAAMVAVLGISESSRADLLSELDALGTNLLSVQAGTGFGPGEDAALPDTADAMLGRIGPVDAVSSVTSVAGGVYRTDVVPEDRTNGISIKAVDSDLLDTLVGSLASGEWLDVARGDLPVTVLGAVTAERLGITEVAPDGVGVRVWISDQWFSVVGILQPLPLAPDIDRAALIGPGIAVEAFDADSTPEIIYLRVAPEEVDAVQGVIPTSANPEDPDQVEVSRPSDAIEARAAASTAFTSLFLGLGAVALLVGGVGIANVMVISVLERRSEIGLRRALGATRRHIAVQFLGEALVLSALGGTLGVALGAVVTAVYDTVRGWAVIVPPIALAGGLGAALAIGAVAGLYPAIRAARMAPTDALRTV